MGTTEYPLSIIVSLRGLVVKARDSQRGSQRFFVLFVEQLTDPYKLNSNLAQVCIEIYYS